MGPMPPRRIPPFIAVTAACMAAICASLAWLALSERRLSLASRTGISSSEGLSAVIAGWILVGAVLAILGILASVSRFRRSIWFALATIWIGAVASYFAWWYR